MADKLPQLGAWSADRKVLEETPISGRGSDADAPDSLRFGRAVVQLVARRELQLDAEYDRPAAFVFSSRAWMERLPAEARREPLLHTGHRPLTGRIHFLNVTANGQSLEYEGGDVELFDKLNSLGVQSFPTLVYSPKQGSSTLSWFPNGTVDQECTELWSIVEELPTVERIYEVISRAYKADLITPDRMKENNQLWVNPAKGWAHENAEARVQHAVRMTLVGAFRLCHIREEQSDKDGRTDLEIVEHQGRSHDQIVHHAVLELKVLREKGSTGTAYSNAAIAKHVRDGLEQASSYGEGRNFRERMLCCFDMRPENLGEDVVFGEVKVDASTLVVHLRHWFLYRSSDHWRKCTVTQKLNEARA